MKESLRNGNSLIKEQAKDMPACCEKKGDRRLIKARGEYSSEESCLDKCLICGKQLVEKGFHVCSKCRSEGWIDCKFELEKERKEVFENAKEALRQLACAIEPQASPF